MNPAQNEQTPAGGDGDGTELPILDVLRLTNAKLLYSLHELSGTARNDERAALVARVDAYLALKREIESRMTPLIDEAGLGDAMADMRRLDGTIAQDLAHLESLSPDARAFTYAVQALHGDVELRIEWERETIEPALVAVLDPERATALAEDLPRPHA